MTQLGNNSNFAVHNRNDIMHILKDMVKQRTAINLDTPDGISLQTAVLKISPDGNHVYMDVGPNDQLNNKIIHSKHQDFSTQAGIRVKWRSSQLHLVSLPDGAAFSIPVPAMLERFQRRDRFRINIPQGSKMPICKMPLGTAILEAAVVNLSAGGVGISIKGEAPTIISQTNIFGGCSIEFPWGSLTQLTFKFCGIRNSIKIGSGEKMHYVGLELIKSGMAADAAIQRYMIQIERERLSLS